MEPFYYNHHWKRHKLLGLRYPWQSRKVATDGMAEEFQFKVDGQLGSIIDCPNLPDNVLRSVEEIISDQTPRPSNNETGSLDVDTSISNALIRSNHRPTPIQMSHFKSRLEGKNLELLDMDYDILRLQLKINESLARMKVLIESRLQKQKEADSCQIWLSYARLLPLDIIIRILQFATSRSSESNYSSSPLKLSHVCSSWRDAALTCSSLWNDLKLSLSLYGRNGDDNDLVAKSNAVSSFIALWFGRANSSLPLNLSIFVISELKPVIGKGLTRGVLPFSSRVESLCFEISKLDRDKCSFRPIEAMTPFLELPAGTFSSLKDLTFIDWTPQKTDEIVPRITVFDLSPLLRKVILRAQTWWFDHEPSLILPWAQLTHLEVGGNLTTSSFANIIFQCRQLQKAIFCRVMMPVDDDEPPSVPEQHLTLPYLTNFKLGLDGPDQTDRDDITDILNSIVLPAVEKLDLSRDIPLLQLFPYDGFPIFSLFPLPGGMYPPLRRLRLLFPDVNLEELLQLLNACPLLEELSLCLKFVTPEELLKALTRAEPSQSDATIPPLSHLQSFAFAASMENLRQDETAENIVGAFGDLVASWVSNPSQRHPLSEAFLCFSDLYRDGDLYRTVPPGLSAQYKEAILHRIGKNSQVTVSVDFPRHNNLCDIFGVMDPIERRRGDHHSYFY